jgi:polysaccharide deacetylase family protein (PEP-CTERM system associated)
MRTGKQVNAFTVDVEEYFHASALAEGIPRDRWLEVPSSVESNTHKILNLLDESSQSGTFFVLGWVCERFPQLVREIHERGHEVASHGHSHKLVYEQTAEEFKAETIRSKSLIEDAIGAPIFGYRAATFSFNQDTLWAYEILREAGFSYDSSVFPISHDRYGDKNAPRFPFPIIADKSPQLIEFPLSTAQVFGMRLPVAGGGYFRLLPPWLINAGLRSVNERENRPFIFYIHPWELDVDQPRIPVSRLSRFRHYTNLDKCEERLRRLLANFKFDTCLNVLHKLDMNPHEPGCDVTGEVAVG